MSTRASRPRSRRGRSAPPGELDPVAESSEEAEALCGNIKPSSGPAWELLESRAQAGHEGLGNRTDQATDGDPGGMPASTPAGPQEPPATAQQPPEAAPPDRTEAPDVFQALQQALSSLEAAAAAWRCQPLGCPMQTGGASGRCEGSAGARDSPPEVARLSERNTWLRLALDSREAELLRARASLQAMQAEKEALQRDVQELQASLRRLESSPPGSPGCAGGPGSDSSGSGADAEPWHAQESSLVSPLLWLHDSSSQILGPVSTHALDPAVKLLEGCTEQLCRRMEKLKSFNRLLLAVLQGFKGRCEDLSMQLGRRAAEATVLGLALQYSERCEEAYRALLALREADPARGAPTPGADLQQAEEEACRLLAQMEAPVDGETSQHSPEGSSVDKPTLQEVTTQLRGLIQQLQKHRALLKIPPEPNPSTAAKPTVPHGEAMVQAILETQPGPALPPLEKTQIQQGLMATRETLADLLLQLQMVRREKRGLELREAALRAQGPAHVVLLEQLQWERAQLTLVPRGADASSGGSNGDESSEEEEGWSQGPPALLGGSSGTDEGQMGRIWDPEKLSQELAASLTRSLGLQQQLQSLRDRLEQMAQRGRASRARSAELHRELCQAHSALVLAFRGAHQKQEEQRRKLEQQLALMGARQAEELARLEATVRALAKPRPPCPPPLLGETLL